MVYPNTEVHELRKAGKPVEAYETAVKYIQEGKLNIYLERELAWSLYDIMSAAKGSDFKKCKNPEVYITWFETAASYNISYEGSEHFYKKLAYLNTSVVKNLTVENDTRRLLELLHALAAWGNAWACFGVDYKEKMFALFYPRLKPVKAITFKQPKFAALRAQGMVDLLDWYTLEYLSLRGSFEPVEKDGYVGACEAELIVNDYIDSLLFKDKDECPVISDQQRKQAAQALKKFFETRPTKEKTENWTGPRYRFAKLLLEVEGAESARPYVIQSLRARPNAIYIQDLIAKNYQDDNEMLAAAAEAKAAESTDAAATEAAASEAPDAAPASPLTPAQTLLSTDSQSAQSGADFFLEWIDTKNGILNVWLNDNNGDLISSRVKDVELATTLKAGEVYHAVFSADYRKIMLMQDVAPDEAFKALFIKSYTGILDCIKDFAFVRTTSGRSLYVSPKQLEESELAQHCLVRGRMVASHALRDGERVSDFVPQTIEFVKELDYRLFRRTLTGTYTRPKSGDFAFVANILSDMSNVDEAYFLSSDSCFVPPAVASDDIANGAQVSVKAERRWNKKKNEWSWEATEILT